jgi:hypothetical protein
MRSKRDLELVRYIVSTCTSALLRLEREKRLMGRSDGEVVSRAVEGACHLVLAHITRPIGARLRCLDSEECFKPWGKATLSEPRATSSGPSSVASEMVTSARLLQRISKEEKHLPRANDLDWQSMQKDTVQDYRH